MTTDLILWREERAAAREIRHQIFNGFARAAANGGLRKGDTILMLAADNPSEMDLNAPLVSGRVEAMASERIALVRVGDDDLRGLWF